jgi:GT2 family glycosyltransferase
MSEPPGPLLSVIIPTHDTRQLTFACLGSLERQGRSALEVIVVDDASSDGTCEAISLSHPAVRLLRSEHPLGFTRAANRGLAAARGEILLLLNSDTEVDPGGLDALLNAFTSDPELGAAGGMLHYPDGSPQWSGGSAPSLLWLFGLASGLPALLGPLPLYRRWRPPAGTGSEAAGRVDWVTGAALGIRRAALARVGPFDETFRFYAQDLDLCLRLAAAGWRSAVVPGFGVLHHHGATIGQRSGGRQNLELLWTDLLYWAGKQRGKRWAAWASRALRTGAALRLVGRGLTSPFLPVLDRAAFRVETAALRRALAAIHEPALAKAPPLV